MKQNFSLEVRVGKTPQEVFDTISEVRLWWTEDFQGSARALNDEFKVTFGETYMNSRWPKRNHTVK